MWGSPSHARRPPPPPLPPGGCTILGNLPASVCPSQAPLYLDELCWMREQVAVRTAIGCTILGSLLAPARPPQAPLCLYELCWMRESVEGRTAIGCTILWDPLQASLLLDELCRMR